MQLYSSLEKLLGLGLWLIYHEIRAINYIIVIIMNECLCIYLFVTVLFYLNRCHCQVK